MRSCKTLPKHLYTVIHPLQQCSREFHFFTFSQTLACCRYYNSPFCYSHLGGWEVVFHCLFHVYFPNDWYCWPSFHVPICHLHIFGHCVYSCPLPIFKLGYLSCCMSSLYTLDIVYHYNTCDLQTFSHILLVVILLSFYSDF